MFTAISRFFESPEDKDPSFIRLVRNILIFAIVATLLSAVVVIATPNSQNPQITVPALIIAGMVEIVAFLYTRRGKVLLAKVIVPVALVIAVTVITLNANTIHDIAMIAYPVIIIAATLIQGRRSFIVTTPLVVGAAVLLGILDMMGRTQSPLAWKTGIDDIVIVTVLLISVSGVLNLLVNRLNQVIHKAESNEKAQIQANQELRTLQSSLEKRVEERTLELTQRGKELEHLSNQSQRRAAQFEAVTQVTQDITSIRDLRELLPRVATVISEKFGFYHVGVFLLDEVNEYAILSATNSAGGRKMIERKHRLRVGEQGIVGNVTKTGAPRIAMDVGADAVFFDNPELADTHSEMALPLKTGNLIIGALDVQSTERAAFTDEDVQMLSLLAHQVGLAIENARLFEETRKALSESEAVSRQTTREVWRSLPTERGLIGYRYTVVGASPLEKPVHATEPASGDNKSTETETSRIVVPIELRGETIGTLIIQSPSSATISQEQLDLIRAVAERVAISAENARLFDETTRRAERERMVSEITSKIRSVNDPQAMIQTAMEELRNALGASRVEVVPQTVRGAEK